MANLQWLKLSTNFFDNNKIKLLESERDGDTLIRVWIQLLTIAMKCNYQGRLSITEDKPMTVDEFSKIMGKSRKKITKCLEKFEELKMIIIEDNFYKKILSKAPLYNHINSAIDIFNIRCDIDKLIPSIKKILRIKYNLRIVKDNPLILKKFY